MQETNGFFPAPKAKKAAPPPPAAPAPSKIPYFVPDPDNIPSQRTGIVKNRVEPAEDNFKYERNPNFDEKILVPNFYQGIFNRHKRYF